MLLNGDLLFSGPSIPIEDPDDPSLDWLGIRHAIGSYEESGAEDDIEMAELMRFIREYRKKNRKVLHRLKTREAELGKENIGEVVME